MSGSKSVVVYDSGDGAEDYVPPAKLYRTMPRMDDRMKWVSTFAGTNLNLAPGTIFFTPVNLMIQGIGAGRSVNDTFAMHFVWFCVRFMPEPPPVYGGPISVQMALLNLRDGYRQVATGFSFLPGGGAPFASPQHLSGYDDVVLWEKTFQCVYGENEAPSYYFLCRYIDVGPLNVQYNTTTGTPNRNCLLFDFQCSDQGTLGAGNLPKMDITYGHYFIPL